MTHFFRNDLTGLFYRTGSFTESNPHLADHLNETEEAFLRTVFNCDHVTRFPSEPEPEFPTNGAAGFFSSMRRARAEEESADGLDGLRGCLDDDGLAGLREA